MARKTRKATASRRENIKIARSEFVRYKSITPQVRSTMFGGSFDNYARFKMVQRALGCDHVYEAVTELVTRFLKENNNKLGNENQKG